MTRGPSDAQKSLRADWDEMIATLQDTHEGIEKRFGVF